MHTDARVLRVTLLSLPYLVPRLCAFLCPRTNFAFGWAGEFLGISKKKTYRTVYGDIHENNLNWRSIVRGERFCYIYGFQIREEGKTMASFKKHFFHFSQPSWLPIVQIFFTQPNLNYRRNHQYIVENHRPRKLKSILNMLVKKDE